MLWLQWALSWLCQAPLRLPAFISILPSMPASQAPAHPTPCLHSLPQLLWPNCDQCIFSFGRSCFLTFLWSVFWFISITDKPLFLQNSHPKLSAVSPWTKGTCYQPHPHSVKHEPQTLLEGKLLVSNKRRVLEIKDILTCTEAFTIFQMVMCSGHPHWWPDVTKYKLLIIKTACLSPGLAGLEYDLAFQKDVTATGTSDWSWMNLDLYSFH